MGEYNKETDDECVEACFGIFKDYSDVEAMELGPSIYEAWQAGRKVCQETEGCRDDE